ncbi:hypothetical protein PHISCL_06216 [Aspergillus sclerotialis]|uniref:Uncharacterized protein n=1 Tax=Aspergillus sclerotialis TaxID=2070753 RepID=A0A3A2ZTX9_9EURO|nr:hypothetical protein PHISCL_06216 [Aspergillus sclerotialis]
MTITPHEEYAELMKGCDKGHFLLRPQPLSKCHPGAIGFFDQYGEFVKITDASEPGLPTKNDFTKCDFSLEREPSREETWSIRTSGSEAEHSFGLDAGVSGALSAAPVDVSAEAKNKWGKTGKAALITGDIVVNDGIVPCGSNAFKKWANDNAEKLRKGNYGAEINQFGLWLISKTFSTRKCNIKLESAHNRDSSGGLNVGATGVAKGGASGSSAVKSNSETGTEYDTTESGGELLVVLHKGYYCRVGKRRFFGGDTFVPETRVAFDPYEFTKPVYDENGNEIGVEYFTLRIDENDEIIEVKVDKEAQAKEAGEDEVAEGGDMVGMTEEEAEAEKAANARYEEQQRQKMQENQARLDAEIAKRRPLNIEITPL